MRSLLYHCHPELQQIFRGLPPSWTGFGKKGMDPDNFDTVLRCSEEDHGE